MTFFKVSDELRTVFGYASVISKNGEPVVDVQGDIIEPQELLKASLDFMADSRTGGFLHSQNEAGEVFKIGEVVASMPFTKDIQDAFGIDLGMEGWAIGIRILDDGVWDLVKSGKLAAFSIGGHGFRQPVED